MATDKDRAAAHLPDCDGVWPCSCVTRVPDVEPTEAMLEAADQPPVNAKIDDHVPLTSVGIVCVCGKAIASMEGVARSCKCGRIWIINVMQVGGPLEADAGTYTIPGSYPG